MMNGNDEALDPLESIVEQSAATRSLMQGLYTPVLNTDATTTRIEAKVDAIVRHDLGQSYPLLAMLGAMLLMGGGAVAVLVMILIELRHHTPIP